MGIMYLINNNVMKKSVFVILLGVIAWAMTACGGVYSVSGGKPDQCEISFVTMKAQPITVNIDETDYQVSTVKQKTYRRDREFKKKALNTIFIKPGQHKVIVYDETGNKIYEHTVFISANEHKVIQL